MMNGILLLGYTMRTSAAMIIFMIVNELSISGVQEKIFLPDLSESGLSKCAHLCDKANPC